jgi:para-aminobenzoate synthetase component 1
MGGRLATSLQEISYDPDCLADGNFWAVLITYEGEFRAARFANVVEAKFPAKITDDKISGNWQSNFSKDEYIQYVESIREQISDGEVYQVNACRQLQINSDVSLTNVFNNILESNPAPYACYLNFDGIEIASASPELFLTRAGANIKTSPIKGTKQIDDDSFGAKDRAENIMIVDLMRNDLSRICVAGSVQVPELLRAENHPGLTHLVSDVTGELRAGISWSEIYSHLLPAGSISGAPKSSATKIIKGNELSERGPYCGIIGWVEGDQAELSVGIRIFWRDAEINKIKFGTGAGITWGSDAAGEWAETVLKAQRLISIVGGEQ